MFQGKHEEGVSCDTAAAANWGVGRGKLLIKRRKHKPHVSLPGDDGRTWPGYVIREQDSGGPNSLAYSEPSRNNARKLILQTCLESMKSTPNHLITIQILIF